MFELLEFWNDFSPAKKMTYFVSDEKIQSSEMS